METIQYRDISFTAWDIGSRDKIVSYSCYQMRPCGVDIYRFAMSSMGHTEMEGPISYLLGFVNIGLSQNLRLRLVYVTCREGRKCFI